MSNTQMERKFFWNRYQETLMENGEPFSLHLNYYPDGTLRYYAQLNSMPSNRCISIDFLLQRRKLRYGIYLDNDVAFYNFLLEQKEKIEAILGFHCDWKHGEKGKNTRRIVCEQEIIPYDHDSYMEAIEESMVRLTKFIQVFERLF